MVDYMRAHAIQGPWAAGERVLVGVNEAPNCAGVVRYARRLADRLRAPWTAIHVETSRMQRLSEPERDRIAESLRLAERLGGETYTVPGRNIAEFRSRLRPGQQFHPYRHRQITALALVRMVARVRDASTDPPCRRYQHPCHCRTGGTGGTGNRLCRGSSLHRITVPSIRKPISISAGFVAAALGMGLVLQQFLAVSNIALVFLTAVLASAITCGLWPALFACLISVLAYNFFFLPPLYTFTIADPENHVALFFFAVVAVIASNLAARTRAEAVTARQRAKTTEELYLFARKLATARHARRSVVGDRVPDRVDAQGQRRPAAA